MRTADHFYYHEPSKIYVPSVTKVLDVISKGEFFHNWLKKNGAESDKILTEAGDFGTNIHNFLEYIGKGIDVKLEALTPRQRRCVEAFNVWNKQNIKTFIETEQSICTPDYGGTLDSVVELVDGRIALLDYKTSAQIYDTHELQVAAYVKAYALNTGRHCDTAFILRFEKKDDKKPDMQEKEVEDIDYKYDLFMCALRLWSFINRKKLVEVNRVRNEQVA